jgi:hypothetical protein
VLEPDEWEPSSPVLRGLSASDGARLLDRNGANRICWNYLWFALATTRIRITPSSVVSAIAC